MSSLPIWITLIAILTALTLALSDILDLKGLRKHEATHEKLRKHRKKQEVHGICERGEDHRGKERD